MRVVVWRIVNKPIVVSRLRMVAPGHSGSGERRRVRAAVCTGNEFVNPWSTSALASPAIGWRGALTSCGF